MTTDKIDYPTSKMNYPTGKMNYPTGKMNYPTGKNEIDIIEIDTNEIDIIEIDTNEIDTTKCKKRRNTYKLASFLYFLIMVFALYLSFLCNNGFDLGAFLMAIFFPYLYIIYKLATAKDFCGLDK